MKYPSLYNMNKEMTATKDGHSTRGASAVFGGAQPAGN